MSCGSAAGSSFVSSSTASKLPACSMLHDFVDVLGLLVVPAEVQFAHAAEAHDHIVEAPQKVEGKKAVTGIAQLLGQVVDLVARTILISKTPLFRRLLAVPYCLD